MSTGVIMTLCVRCHEREALAWPGPERFEGFRHVDTRLADALVALVGGLPKDICGDCFNRDPELRRIVRERFEAVSDRINALLLPRMAGEYLRRQVARLLDVADGLVERFRK